MSILNKTVNMNTQQSIVFTFGFRHSEHNSSRIRLHLISLFFNLFNCFNFFFDIFKGSVQSSSSILLLRFYSKFEMLKFRKIIYLIQALLLFRRFLNYLLLAVFLFHLNYSQATHELMVDITKVVKLSYNLK